jgi:hypothetical protein
MPKIFEYFGFIFFLYANDHKPLHVHVRFAEFESIVEIEIKNGKLTGLKFKKVKDRGPIPISDRKNIEIFISTYYLRIVEKWTQFYLLNQSPKSEKITRKLR